VHVVLLTYEYNDVMAGVFKMYKVCIDMFYTMQLAT